jgi:hypothetical protein
MNDMIIGRRQLLGATALLPVLVTLPGIASAARPDLSRVKSRTTGKVEVLYKSPYFGANGLDITPEGLWIIHQIAGNQATLVDLDTGKLIREVVCEGVLSASGICIDAGTMWIGSTYNRLIVACDPATGKLIQKYSTPGAGQIFKMTGDQPGGRTPLEPAWPRPEPAAPPPGGRATGGRRGAGKQDATTMEGPPGTGAHCILAKGKLLYVDVPPARQIFAIDKDTWVVEDAFYTAGDRPHDMTWANADKSRLWCADSNYNAFFLHDVRSGDILQRVDLPSGSPVIHGAKLHGDWMYMCDDVGWVSRVRFT